MNPLASAVTTTSNIIDQSLAITQQVIAASNQTTQGVFNTNINMLNAAQQSLHANPSLHAILPIADTVIGTATIALEINSYVATNALNVVNSILQYSRSMMQRGNR
jgi:hypothetical protein